MSVRVVLGRPMLRRRREEGMEWLPWHMAAAVRARGVAADDELGTIRYVAATSIHLVNRP